MKEYSINVLKDAANRLLLDMSESEYETLLSEFDIVTKQMKAIGDNKTIDQYIKIFKKKKKKVQLSNG